ncbi:ATP-binding cassette domain-containing protein, partial [Pseudomonas sp.]|uniref:ATP-binding cassette domain-containing protein n=1 Tax=Pseudomonas sp. TaxID=306 RepID=UPI0026DBFA9A
KRAALALAFALEPDLLLLDEPTNHLDIDAIEALERVINNGPAAIIITHDRRFLDQVATRIIELDRGLLRSFPGNFATYERVRGEQLEAEAVARRKFDKFWAQEEVWIRKGIEARRTRNEGRVRRLEALREERAARRERAGQVRLDVDAGERSGKLVCELQKAGISLGGRALVRELDLTILRGDRIGLIGPNGVGKSTLLKLILGEHTPDSGRVRLGSNLQVAYFDQLREQLDPERTLGDTVSPGSEYVEINGVRRHIISYLQDFLFSSNRVNSPVRTLSGGERNRLLLARLFARPANLLVLDEPTNDLDLESIELLESMLQTYHGTLLLVSHDRSFLDNVVTSVLVAQGDGRWLDLVGGYADWMVWRERHAPSGGEVGASVMPGTDAGMAAGAGAGAPLPSADALRRGGKLSLSNREVRELASLPGEIEALETEHAAALAEMSSAEFFRQDTDTIKAFQARVAEQEARLTEMMTRWEALLAREAEVNASRGR